MSEVPRVADEVELAQIKESVFHAVGRNLVTLQHMETMLRTMCSFCRVRRS